MHLVADMFTSKGIPILHPFRKKRYKMPVTIKVGSWLGNVVEASILLTLLLYIVLRLPNILSNFK